MMAGGGWRRLRACDATRCDAHRPGPPQEAAIGSTTIHPNIISVYSITLRPAAGAAAASLAAAAAAANTGTTPGDSGLLMLDEGGSGGASWGQQRRTPGPTAASLELLPWEMQLVMEWADQVWG